MKMSKMVRNITLLGAVFCLMMGANPAMAQATNQTPAATARPPRPAPPTRDPNTPGFVTAKELPDDTVPSVDVDGNFVIGPTHHPAPEMIAQTNVPHGF